MFSVIIDHNGTNYERKEFWVLPTPKEIKAIFSADDTILDIFIIAVEGYMKGGFPKGNIVQRWNKVWHQNNHYYSHFRFEERTNANGHYAIEKQRI